MNTNCTHKTCPLLSIELIPLTQGKYAIVDKEDYSAIGSVKWFAVKNYNVWYAHRSINKKGKIITLRMHRVIMNAGNPKIQIDHKNTCGLDNRRCNLRRCTNSQNQMNIRPAKNKTSKYKGVCFDKKSKKWKSKININGKQETIGYYNNEIMAAKSYDSVAKIAFGEFSRINFPAVYERVKP